jgi:hypothetical protein
MNGTRAKSMSDDPAKEPADRRHELQEERLFRSVNASLEEPEAHLLSPGSWLLSPVFQ